MWYNFDNSISIIGCGCWGFGNNVYGERTEKQDIDILDSVKKTGVNFFDTAPLYGNSEKIIGNFIKKNNPYLHKTQFVATKVGMVDENKWDLTTNAMIDSINKSFSKLPNIDLIQLHSPPKEMITEQVVHQLTEFKRTKACKWWGISYKSPQDAMSDLESPKYNKLKRPDFIQINYSLLDQRAKQIGLLDYCIAKEINIIARTPLCFGYLCSDIDEVNLESTDHRLRQNEEKKQKWKSGFELFRKLKGDQETMAQFALRFCWSSPGIKTTIPGCTSIEQAQENGTLAVRSFMTETELNKLYGAYLELEGK